MTTSPDSAVVNPKHRENSLSEASVAVVAEPDDRSVLAPASAPERTPAPTANHSTRDNHNAANMPEQADPSPGITAPVIHSSVEPQPKEDDGPSSAPLALESTAATPARTADTVGSGNDGSTRDDELYVKKPLDLSAPGITTRVDLTDHGLDVDIEQDSLDLADIWKPTLEPEDEYMIQHIPAYLSKPAGEKYPVLNVVIQIVGSRGDVQPFVSLGKVLREKYGHRVRIATHLVFKELVEENGLEFFSIGGDPAELMAFMVHNPGLIPDVATLRSGEVGKRRRGTHEMLVGCWRSCIEAGDGTGLAVFEGGKKKDGSSPFIADAIIANPPSFAHIHCAEKLGIPLHLMFTMPWSPTKSFPHPLVNIKSSNADGDQTNFITYALVEMMTWQGLGDVINTFRRTMLNLEPISLMWAPGMNSRLRVPFTYCWSPALIPKPKDWGPHISISGFYFLSLASSFTPDPALLEFLAAGPPPVYIGFGSIVVDDPDGMTKMMFDAVKKAGVRALVSKGWGGLGAPDHPKEIFMLGNIPHDWLFHHVSAVVHHGGAGTTAAGIAAGKPTVVVPFFGDQPFWGAMIARAGAGPQPIPYKRLNVDNLVAQLQFVLKPETLVKAKELGEKMAKEKGAEEGAALFHQHLGDDLLCSVLPDQAALWRIKKTDVKLSGMAATVLINRGLVDLRDLKLYRAREYQLEDGPWDPVSGVATTLLGTLGSLAMGIADLPTDFYHTLKTKNDKHTGISAALHTNSNMSSTSLPVTRVEKANHDIGRPGNWTSLSHYPVVFNSTINSTSAEAYVDTETSNYAPSTSDLSTTSTAISANPSRVSTVLDPSNPTSPLSPHELLKHRPSQATRSAAHAAEFIIKGPMNLASSIAQGFHNAPKLYGDATVRHPDSITGFQSGLKAAGKEFTLGIYDGVSGLVTQPVRGTKEHGVAGLLSGVVKGVGGLVLKPASAVTSLPANLLKGMYKELEKSTDFCLQTHVMLCRTWQGIEAAKDVDPVVEEEIIRKWQLVMIEADERTKEIDCAITGRKHTCHHGLKFRSTRHMTLKEAQMHSAVKGLKMSTTAPVQRFSLDSDEVSFISTDSEEGIDPKMEVKLSNGKMHKIHLSLYNIIHRIKVG